MCTTDNVFISNTTRYFIGHLIFCPLPFFINFSSLAQFTRRATKRREIRGVNLLTPLMGVENQGERKSPNLIRRDVVFRSFIGEIAWSEEATFQYFHAIYVHARIAYAKPDKKTKLLLYFRNCSMSLCNLDTRIYEIVFSFSFFFPPSIP